MAVPIALFAFNFILDKLRDCATKKLQNGDLTGEKFRCYIMRDLDKIHSKLDSVLRIDLLTSISRLKQGVSHLNIYPTGTSSAETRPAQTSVTVEGAIVLANAIGRVTINSDGGLEKARECFKQAGDYAGRAFLNTELSIEDRILANKVRMASTMLENLHYPDVAAGDCLYFLKELHAIPAIQKLFSVHVYGGIMSIFKKDSRREAIQEVKMMNLKLSDFITKFATTRQRMAVFEWPMIYFDKLLIHPIHFNEYGLNQMTEMEMPPIWDLCLLTDLLHRLTAEDRARNSCVVGTLCVPCCYNMERGLLKLQMPILRNIKDMCLSPVKLHLRAHCVAVDEDDSVYVLKISIGSFKQYSFSVQIYAGDGHFLKDICLKLSGRQLFFLNFSLGGFSCYLGKDKNHNLMFCIVSYFYCFANLYDNDGEVVSSFPKVKKLPKECILVSSDYKTVSIPNKNFSHISVSSIDREIAFVNTQENQLKGIVQFDERSGFRHSNSSLWNRYLPIIHLMADGKTSRCLHSSESVSSQVF